MKHINKATFEQMYNEMKMKDMARILGISMQTINKQRIIYGIKGKGKGKGK